MYPPPKDSVDKSPQLGLTNKLARFVVLSMYERFGTLQDGSKPSDDVGHFYAWIKRKGQNDHCGLIEEARQLARDGSLVQYIEELVSKAPGVMEVKIAKVLHDNVADILYQRRTGMDVIISENLPTPFYHEFALHQGIPVDDEEGNPNDREFSWQDGCMWVSRHVPDAGFHSQHGLDSQSMKTELLPLSNRSAVRATFETPGVLNSLRFMTYKELWRPLPPGFIDVAVAAVGVNSRLDHWSGRLDGNSLS